jgi:flagellar hook protein FlgE
MAKMSNNLYSKTTNDATDPLIIGTPMTNGLGAVESQSLEMSNVDIAQEFVNMISAQRAFSANSKVITTSDEMLQELVNIKR